jgi:ureidoglycolate lyase
LAKLAIERLTRKAFAPFGTFARLIDPVREKIGEPPIEFFRDIVQVDLGRATAASLSTCRVARRPQVIDVSEYHTATGEGILPLDGAVAIHVAPATPPGPPPVERFRVFRVPMGTVVSLRPGVWHHAPFALDGDAANVLIILPERAYANDCVACPLPPEQHKRFG